MRRLTLVGAVFFAMSMGLGCGEAKPPAGANDVKPGDEPKPDDPPVAPPKPSVPDPAKKSANEYDKENTDVVLKRAGRSAKDSCGDAKDDSGAATGPWGKVTIQVMLGRNGHSKAVTVPASHAEKPVGRCIVNAFSNLTFPPWAGQDTQVDWEVELVQPAAPPPVTPKKK